MKRKDIQDLSQSDLFFVASAVDEMGRDMKAAALSGIYAVICEVGSNGITVGKCFQDIYFGDIYLQDGNVKINYLVEEKVRQAKLEEFDPWIVTRIALKVYKAWEGLVKRGILEAPKPKVRGK